MIERNVALIAETKKISPAELTRVEKALQKRLHAELAPIWEVSATVQAYEKIADAPPDAWPMWVRDNIKTPGGISYHSETKGKPFAMVEHSETWPFLVSHDLVEMLVVSELDYLRHILDSITLMQHYGAPTRLLDWTLSPWVACYFAAQEHHDEDAAIWIFNRDELDKANHSHRQSRSRDFARFSELASASTVEDWAWSAIRAGPYIGSFRYEYANPQMGAQQSLFTISGQLGDDHDLALARSLPEAWQTLRVIMSKSHKEALRKRLFGMNVGPLNLFPNIDGVGRHIREALQSGFPLGDEGLLWSLRGRVKRKS